MTENKPKINTDLPQMDASMIPGFLQLQMQYMQQMHAYMEQCHQYAQVKHSIMFKR